MAPAAPLPAEALRRACDPSALGFETTAELTPLEDSIGQERAQEALAFGLGIRQPGYGLFILGPTGAGRHSVVRHCLTAQAARDPVPSDLCYVHNFAEPRRPRALRLPSGVGVKLRQDMQALAQELGAAIPAAFETQEYRLRKEQIAAEFKERQEKGFEDLRQRAEQQGIALVRTPVGLALAPMKDGEVLSPQEFEQLPEARRRELAQAIKALQVELQDLVRRVPVWEREHRERQRELSREVARFAVGHLIDELRQRHTALTEVIRYLDEVQADIVENTDAFLEPQGETPAQMLGMGGNDVAGILRRYRVNCLVDHSQTQGAPVVYDDQPSYHDLLGRVEHLSQLGTLVTDFTLIRPGSLHKANGGYLVLDAHRLLVQPFAWEGLKRALLAGEIRIESLAEKLSLISTVSLEAEPVPLDVKVILIGERIWYYLLQALDPDFGQLFKVAVDLEDDAPRTQESQDLYARWLGTIAGQHGLRPLTRDAAAAVIEQAARLCGDSERLTLHQTSLVDLLREADFWAAKTSRSLVTAKDIEQAIEAQRQRHGRVRERVLEEIQRGTILIDVTGSKIGQVNGLSVIELGGHAFGRPSRITARVRVGKGEVIDIEREVELGGPIHSKGVLILAGFLGERYARERPLTLSASLVFEQSYSGVEGDSASSAELYALLSALAQVPVRQGLAVTGSVNQHGDVQPVGGVNEKIEGFFDVCRARGLTGEQGVLIPAANVKHLMLRPEVVEAARQGRFHVWPVATIDEGIALMTGCPAGTRGADGRFPPESINRRVEERLEEMALRTRAFLQAGSPVVAKSAVTENLP